ncbi:MAG: response regulator [Chlorobium sp.]|nr:response regulator [Chlorobium sp.]
MNKRSILIVEDEAIVAEDLANKVRQLGYEVAGICMTGEEAVQLARQHRPALVLMDICLAGAMDGIATSQAIHSECKLPVLFLTAHSDTATVTRARQAEAFGYILKPFSERDLRIQIEMALYKHAAEWQLFESKEHLSGINQILQAGLTCMTEQELGLACLDVAKKITQSRVGFIGDINKAEFENLAICNSGVESCNLLDPSGHRISPGNFKIHGIYGRVIMDGKSLFTNDPTSHPDRIGLPEGHYPLTSFLGVPLLREGSVIGLLAVGNREKGYTQVEQDTLEALTPSIVEAFARKRAEEKLHKSAAELQKANAKLLDSHRATINMMQDAVIARRQAEEVSLALQREIAVRKEAENALQMLNNELEQRVEQRTLELQKTQKQYLHAEKLSAIGKLSASIAHEFNNPLQGILAVLKGLRRRAVLEEEDKELLDEAIEESDRIKDLIRNLQEFNRPSTGRKSSMDVHKALDSVLLLYKSDFKGKRISVVLDYAEGLPEIQAVSDQIKQVFLNMLTNAADACHQPGGVITVKTWQEDSDRVAVVIKDSGVGIQPSDIELIFQPFYTTKPEVKGTGLGLSISHGIIKNHQGEIRVESAPGEGATFTILLPIKHAEVDT